MRTYKEGTKSSHLGLHLPSLLFVQLIPYHLRAPASSSACLSLSLLSLPLQMCAPFPLGGVAARCLSSPFFPPRKSQLSSSLPCSLGAQLWAGFPAERLFIVSLLKQCDSYLETPGCLSLVQTRLIRADATLRISSQDLLLQYGVAEGAEFGFSGWKEGQNSAVTDVGSS